MNSIRAKVLDTDYDESRKLIKWLIKDLDNNSDFTIAWLDEDLKNQFNIKQDLPPDVIRKFCSDMLNKEFNLVMTAETQTYDSDFFKDEDKVSEASHKLERFPFREVLEQIEEDSMKVRLFGLEDCENCKLQREVLESKEIPYYYIDADADDQQDLCDEQDVDEVPHIQLLHQDKVVFQHVGFCSPDQILKVASEIGSKIK